MKTNIFAPNLFKDRVVLISGATGGVGSATADLLSSLGANLALTDYKEDAIVDKAISLNAFGIQADISSVADCQHVIEKTISHYRRLDALVNCAGVWVEGDSTEQTEEDWDRCLNVNLKGTFFMCSKAIPALKESRGAIVNISSDAGVVGNPGAAIYCASKGGVTLMSRSLALELAPYDVRVNALCPSDIMSPMLQFQAERYGNGDNQQYYNNLLNKYPQGPNSRFITPAEVASYIAYLLSPAAEPVTGATVMLDFGVTAGY